MYKKRVGIAVVLSFLIIIGVVSVSALAGSTGSEIAVGTLKTAISDYGTTVVVWEENEDIYYKLYSDTGATLISSTRVNTCHEGDQHNPEVDMADNGEFVVTWSTYAPDARKTDDTTSLDDNCDDLWGKVTLDDGNKVELGYDIALKKFNYDGSVDTSITPSTASNKDANGEIRVNNHDGNCQTYKKTTAGECWWAGLEDDKWPDVAIDSENEKIVVVWQSEGKSAGNIGVYGKVLELDNLKTVERASGKDYANYLDTSKFDADKYNNEHGCSDSVNPTSINNYEKNTGTDNDDISCLGAISNEVPLFEDIDGNKQFPKVAIANNLGATGKGAYVVVFSKYTSSGYANHVRAFSIDDSSPLTNTKRFLESGSYGDVLLYPKVTVMEGVVDSGEDLVVMAWTGQNRDKVRYSMWKNSDLELYGTRGDNLLTASSGYCVYGSDIESVDDKTLFSYYRTEDNSDGECETSFGSVDWDTNVVKARLSELSSKELIKVSGFNVADVPGVKTRPRLSSNSENFAYVYKYSDTQWEMLGFDTNGDETDIVKTKKGEEDADVFDEQGCEFYGCDCDGNGYMDTGDRVSALGYALCAAEPGTTPIEGFDYGAWCDDQEGTWVAETDVGNCLLGEEDYPGQATGTGDGSTDTDSGNSTDSSNSTEADTDEDSGEGETEEDPTLTICYDGIDNDGDGSIDFGGCDVDGDLEIDSTCEDYFNSGVAASKNVVDCYNACKADANGTTQRFYPSDAGCVVSEIEWNRCGDKYDNDKDGLADYKGGCDTDGDKFIDYVCGCDYDGNGDLATGEFGVLNSECTDYTWGCKAAVSPDSEATFTIEYEMSCEELGTTLHTDAEGVWYSPDPECTKAGDDSERDSGLQKFGETGSESSSGLSLAPGSDEGQNVIQRLWNFLTRL
jgi:hypothetical protein